MRKTYTDDYKKKAILKAKEIGITNAASYLDLSYNLLYKWVKSEDYINSKAVSDNADKPKTPMRELRESANLTQKEFANYLGVTLKSIRAWEQGLRHPISGFEGIVYRLMVAEQVIPPDIKQ